MRHQHQLIVIGSGSGVKDPAILAARAGLRAYHAVSIPILRSPPSDGLKKRRLTWAKKSKSWRRHYDW